MNKREYSDQKCFSFQFSLFLMNSKRKTIDSLFLNQNRGTPCGQHSAEIIHQLRQLAKSEYGFDYDLEYAEPPTGFQSLMLEQHQENECNSCENKEEFVFPTYEV